MNNYATASKTTDFIKTSITSFLLKRKNNNGYKQQQPTINQLYDTLRNKRHLKDIAAVKIINENLLTVEDAGYLFIVYLTTNSFSVYRYFHDISLWISYLRRQKGVLCQNYVLKERDFTGELKKIYVQSRISDDNKIYIKKNNTYYELEKSIII